MHCHHGREGAFRLLTAGRHRGHKHARRDLPRDAPAILAPAAGAFLPAIADDCVPQAVRLGLIVGGDLERESLIVPEGGPAVQADARDAGYGERTVST